MITTERILEIADKHFNFIDEYSASGWIADTEDLLKFANEIYNEGHEDGWDAVLNMTR